MKKLYFISLLIFCSSCAMGPAFRGPQFDQIGRKVRLDPNQKVVVALTNAILDSNNRVAFDRHTREIYDQLDTNSGYIGGSIRREIFGNEVWTMTVWENREALDRFRNSEKHRMAKREGNPALKVFRHLNFEVLASEIPLSWERAEEILKTVEFKAPRY